MTYNDHHLYNDKDVDAIMKRTANVDFVLTTEKDMQRLALTTLPQKLEKANKKLIVLPTSVLFRTDSNAFDRQILTYVRENNRKK
jgi:tetraacyldisaccharide-1-P 4'-kinase